MKLYIDEDGSAEFRRQSSAATRLASSLVAYAEVRATLATAQRLGRHTPDEHTAAVADFERDWLSMTKIHIDDALVKLAGALVEDHALRGFDAIHLASALTLQRELGQPISFSAFDSRLTTAAAACGLSLV